MPEPTVPAERLARHPFWHAVGLGMTPYAYLGFRLETVGGAGFRFAPGTLFVCTHRAETDAPLIIGSVYWHSGAWRDMTQRLHFAARDDLFEPGFFAGFPPGLPPAARRLLYPLAIERFLPMVRVHPLGSARRLKLSQALRLSGRDAPLAGLLPPELLGELERRAAEAGLPRPRTAGDALRAELADLLWRDVTPEDVPAPGLWATRTADSKRQVSGLVDLVRAGEPLLVFPEGRPSPDGAVGPVQRGLGLLVRRGRPEAIRPLAITYDPLVRGRTLAVVALGEPFPTGGREAEEQVLAALRRTMPLTAGSYAAHAVAAAAREGRDATTDELAEGLAAAVAEAAAEGRPLERRLRDRQRLGRLSEALGVLRRRGLLRSADGRALQLDRERLLADRDVRRLEREYASVRGS